jgi:hypothetical protein
LAAVVGELVDDTAPRWGLESPAQDAGFFKFPEPGREDVGGDAGEPCFQLFEALGSVQEIPNDEQGPPAPDEIEGVGKTAIVAVHPGHGTIIAPLAIE